MYLWRRVVPECPVCGMQCSPTSSVACQGHGPSPGVPCRDLSKPMGALNASRLAKFRLRFEEMPRGEVRPCQVPASLIPEVTGVHQGPWLLHSGPGLQLAHMPQCALMHPCLQCMCTVLKHNSAICLRIKAWKFAGPGCTFPVWLPLLVPGLCHVLDGSRCTCASPSVRPVAALPPPL